MERGELWWTSARLPGERHKRRPVIVVSSDAFNRNERYPKVMVVHLTTVRGERGPYSWEVPIAKGTAGLPSASVAKCAEVYTLWKDQLGERIGTLPREVLRRLDRALAVALSLPSPAGDA